MTYAVTNPPVRIAQTIGGASLWLYKSADAIATADNTDYITNADELGMKTGDPVFVVDSANGLTSLGQVTLDADGNGTLTALTAFP